MSSRGVLEVADGGVVEIAEELLLTGLSGDCARPTHCVILRDGKLSAASVSLVEGELLVEPAGRLDVTTTVRVEDPAHEGALLDSARPRPRAAAHGDEPVCREARSKRGTGRTSKPGRRPT